MMFVSIFFKILLTLVGFSISYVIHRVYHNYQVRVAFKRKAPHIKILPVTSWLTGNADMVFDKRCWKVTHENHKRLGETIVFFYGDLAVVSTTDLDFIKKFAIDDGYQHINRAIPNLSVDELEHDNIMFAKDKQWLRLRKVIAPAFSLHKVKSPNVIAEVTEIVDRFIRSIEWRLDMEEKKNGQKFIIVDVENLSHRYSLSLVYKCFYKQSEIVDFNLDVDPVEHFVQGGYNTFGSFYMQLTTMFPILRPIIKYFASNYHPTGHVIRGIIDFIKQQTNLYLEAKKQFSEAEAKGEKVGSNSFTSIDEFRFKDGSVFKKNMVDYIIEKYSEGAMSKTEYINSTMFLFFASDKTSSDAISKVIYCLAENQDVQDKVRNSVLAEGIESEYLSWVLNETMRLYPPAKIGCSRTISKDLESKAGIIPAGAFIITPIYSIHRLKQYWGEDAEEFKPERWRDAKKFHPVQYLAFGAGKRACPGREFALHEMKHCFEALLSRYKFELTDREYRNDEFMAPFFVFNVAEFPCWIKISRLKQN